MCKRLEETPFQAAPPQDLPLQRCYVGYEHLIENVGRIRHIPGVIIHGRYDLVCPIRNAWDLHRAWPEAELTIVPDAGHTMFELGTRTCLLAATEAFKRIRRED